MRHIALAIAFSALIAASCTHSPPQTESLVNDPYSYELGVVGGFSEMIRAGVKKLALSAPMSPAEMDHFEADAKKIAERYDVQVYRESDLLVTSLFPEDVTAGKEVLLLYQGNSLDQYFALKSDKEALENSEVYDAKARLEISRRFGRMLSYSSREINRLLSQNTSFRTLNDFGIRAANLFLYYEDLDRALDFYTNTLGLEMLADYEMAYILRVTTDSYLILVDASKGMHTSDEPKTVALALLTAQLDEWYTYLKDLKVPIKYDYYPEEGSAHDGFVAVDPEGYLLEFERFNQHPENESFIPILRENEKDELQSGAGNSFPEDLKIHSTITWLYYQDLLYMQNYYQDQFGLTMVADQGWTKIYQVSNTGFLGLVDCRRGMKACTKEKAVNVGYIIDDLEGWFDYVNENKVMELYEDELGTGPEGKYKAFVGFCPEGYYLEFDHFYSHVDNAILLNYLKN